MPGGVTNAAVLVSFTDFDDPLNGNTIPFTVAVVSPSTFSLSPASSTNPNFTLTYSGVLNRTVTKNLTVTINATDVRGRSTVTTIPIIVSDVPNNSPISNGFKTMNVIYVNGYQNSLQNVGLGSIYVVDSNDWFRANNVYSVRDVSNGQTFVVNQGLLNTPTPLYPGSYTIRVDVTKPSAASSALSTIDLGVTSVDSEFVRQAATIRVQGK